MKTEGAPIGAPIFCLAAAAVVVAAAAVVVIAADIIAAAAGEQQDQNDDPPAVVSTKTIITHKITSKNFLSRLSRSFQDIPEDKICAGTDLVCFSAFTE